MKKINSLKRNEQIAKIVHHASPIRNEIYNIYVVDNNLEYTRVCISVSKKLGIAVLRNRVKRQVREMISSIFDFSQRKDIVIKVKNEYLAHEFLDNKQKLVELYLKIIPQKESE